MCFHSTVFLALLYLTWGAVIVHLLVWCYAKYCTTKFPGFSLVNRLIKLDIC